MNAKKINLMTFIKGQFISNFSKGKSKVQKIEKIIKNCKDLKTETKKISKRNLMHF